MITREFVHEEDSEYGGLGLRMACMTNANALNGMAAAHDMLEHFPNDNGTVEEEFMALGALLYVREEWYWANKGQMVTDRVSNLRGELVMQYGYARTRGKGNYIRNPGRVVPIRDEYIENVLGALVVAGIKYAREEDRKEAIPWIRNNGDSILGWMRRGYRRAIKRYQGYSSNHMTCAFLAIEEAANKAIKYADYEGQRVIISANVRRCTAQYRFKNEDY